MTREEKRERDRRYYLANQERIIEAARKRYVADPEKAKQRIREWQAANVERKREYQRKYYAATPEKQREKARKWSAGNREKLLAATRKWRATNPEKVLKYSREYHKTHPEIKCSSEHRRRARLLDGCSPGVTPAQWLEIVETFDGRCAYCLRKGLPLERDHVIPIKRGGRDEPDNVVPACERCNCSKSASILPLWYARSINQKRI